MSDLAQRARDAGFSEWLVNSVAEFVRAELEAAAQIAEELTGRYGKEIADKIRERQR